ncbi:hypothetical protein Acr_24g0010510 [Actinidia rufa]|uniref:Uncharacterized protein n=1 Tax=Actinidia rufa TaxID=165716 RepID=A0A7J0GVU6_9ERIC|nr:hypothetical protein Acr_24g0010510 [Actinidia rufa]
MSFNTNLGGEESEQSLPSWISDHLGAKSYIDETTQSTSSPIPTSSSKMDTSSLTKESNVMSQADLDNLGTTYSFPQGVRLRIPGDGETILSARQGEVAFYEAAFLAGLRFPIHPTIRDILIHYQICPARSCPPTRGDRSYVRWRGLRRTCSEDPEQRKGVEDEVLFCLGGLVGVSPGRGCQREFTTSSQILGNTSCNKLPTLSEVDAKRMEAVFGKIEPGGYFDVSKVLNSRTFKRHFAGGCSAFSTSGGDNTTSGDEGEFDTGEDSVEYWKIRLRISYLGRPASSSDSGSDSISDSELPPELRSDDAMSARGKAVAEKAKKARQPSIPPKGAKTPCRPRRLKGSNPTEGDQCRGRAAEAGTSSPAGDGESQSMSDASVSSEVAYRVIPTSDKKEVDQLSENDLVAKSFHALGQVVVYTSSLALRSQEHLHDIDFHMARADSAQLELAKELAIEDFKASEEFKAAVTDSAATYFGDGFEFCKRQLLHQFPNLGADVANMAMDPSFAEEEEATKEGGEHV